jgi:nitrogen fixation/metabolism regulation signal transduction histidine kinase
MSPGIADLNEYLRTVLDAIPFMVLVVDADMKIHDANLAAVHLLGDEYYPGSKRHCGEALRCIHAIETVGGCGKSPFCRECVCRTSAEIALGNTTVSRQKCHMTILKDGKPEEVYFDVTAAPFACHEDHLVLLLLEDTTELMLLRKIAPICMYCKRIRNADNSWENIEEYLLRYNDLKFTHSLCPECRKNRYPEDISRR